MILSLLALAAPVSPAAQALPDSLPQIVQAGGDESAAIISFRAGRARCRGGEEALLLNEPPLPVVAPWGAGTRLSPVTLSFRIDSGGRPLSISEEPRLAGTSAYFNRGDMIAAFAASRFRDGAERSGCTITYEAKAEPVETAELGALYRFVALQPPPQFSVRHKIFERTTPAGSTCFNDPRLNVRLRAYPAFEEIPQAPGSLSYSFVGFDLDRGGRPRDARLLGSSGNQELDRQSLDAVRRSRFSPIAKRGCIYSYWRRQTDPLRAPEMPPADAYPADPARCPKEGSPWAYMPPLTFPSEFERRGIEGWAVVRFDVAPWGAVGNVSALAAEPAAPFGQQAVQILSGARKPPSGQGYSGCVARVLFKIGAAPDFHPILDP
jgi:TonB family protein